MELNDFFKQFHNISETDYDLLSEKLKPKTFKKGDFLTVPG
ncbi:MAG: Crp/Fnr family transcriptional regulator, partial [Chitinophagaceae bacterium]